MMDLLVGEGRCGISSQREAKANDWVTHHHHPQRLHLRTKSWERRGGHCHELVEMKKTKTALQEELLDMMPKRERTIKRLQTELNLMENKSRTNKKTLQERMGWSGEEINFADSINTLLSKFSYFQGTSSSGKDGRTTSWIRKIACLHCALCLRKLLLPEGSNTDDIRERVIVPLIQMKYVNTKGNMNNDLKKIYMGMLCVLYDSSSAIYLN